MRDVHDTNMLSEVMLQIWSKMGSWSVSLVGGFVYAQNRPFADQNADILLTPPEPIPSESARRLRWSPYS